jgi:tetratricopeptide (TPR) repeat protein
VGSKLAVLAAVVGLSSAAFADTAGELMKKGIEQYKAGKYTEAAATLQRVYDLDHKPETLFALAQAQRLAGDCTSAAANYHKVIAQVSDVNTARLVQQNLSLCEKDEPKPAPPPEPKAEPAAPPEPQVITKTVVRDRGKTDKLAATMFGVGMLGLGAAGGLYLASSSNADAADNARTLDEHNRLASRASSESTGMVIAAGVGVAALGYAVFRWTRGGETSKTEVAAVPTTSGGAIWVRSSF